MLKYEIMSGKTAKDIINYDIPKEIMAIVDTLQKAGFEAYLVGGCVRDLMLPAFVPMSTQNYGEAQHRKPKDWDITTNAKPEQIQGLFAHSVYENDFGTVAVINDNVEDQTLKVVEVTPYRLESKYSDKRHPDEVRFTCNLNDDLGRRDFTVNAMAINIKHEARSTKFETNSKSKKLKTGIKNENNYEIVDLFNGQEDLKNKILRAVGEPEKRFGEDALRMLRAVRFSAELGFEIEVKTKEAIKKNAHLLKMIAEERIKDEFVKIIMSDSPKRGIELSRELGILKYVAPEIEEGWGVGQNRAHKFNVWDHNLLSLEHAANSKWPLEIRLAALLHDVGKPASKRWSDEKKDYTFYGHEVIGAKMAVKILSRLKFPVKLIELVAKFIRYHMFFSDTETITLSAVRRVVRNIGPEYVWDLMKVRFCDRIGMGRPKETPYRLRKYEAMIDEAMRAPLSVTMLKIDGNRLIEMLHVQPGPKIGNILHLLFEEVMDAPEKNTAEWLENRAKALNALSDAELSALGKKAKETKEKAEDAEIKEIRKKWWVK